MKKILLYTLCLLLSAAFLLQGCNKSEIGDDHESRITDGGTGTVTENGTADGDPNTAENPSAGISFYSRDNTENDVGRPFRDYTYDSEIIADIVGRENFGEDIWEKCGISEDVPQICTLIGYFGITRGQFEKQNAENLEKSGKLGEPRVFEVYTDEEIDAIFSGDVNRAVQALKNDTTFYHDGKIYLLSDLIKEENADLVGKNAEELKVFLNGAEKIIGGEAMHGFASLYPAVGAEPVTEEMWRFWHGGFADDRDHEVYRELYCINYYPDELTDYSFLTEFVGEDEINAFLSETVRGSSAVKLPPVYRIVRHFGITGEQLGQLGGDRFTERELEIMFGDHSDGEVKNALKCGFVYYFGEEIENYGYSGEIYNLHDLLSGETVNGKYIFDYVLEKDRENLREYFAKVKAFCDEKYAELHYSVLGNDEKEFNSRLELLKQ